MSNAKFLMLLIVATWLLVAGVALLVHAHDRRAEILCCQQRTPV